MFSLKYESLKSQSNQSTAIFIVQFTLDYSKYKCIIFAKGRWLIANTEVIFKDNDYQD